jgi:hypothetical protein
MSGLFNLKEGTRFYCLTITLLDMCKKLEILKEVTKNIYPEQRRNIQELKMTDINLIEVF